MNELINYTIIIPHYNLVSLLCRCLNSIPKRKDIEVIVVDDISDDTNRRLLKTMTVNENVKIIEADHKGGAGHARNIGLTNSHGKWLLFADADDYFVNGFDKILDRYKDGDNDLIFFDFETRVSSTKELKSSRVIGSSKAFKNNDIDFFKYRFHGPWAKLIRRSLVINNNIFFDETICSNDTFFSGKIGKAAKNAFIVPEKIYVTTIREGSLVHNMTEKSLSTRLKVSTLYNRFLKLNNKDKYRINLLSLIYYYRAIDKTKFHEKLIHYLKEESIQDIICDFCKSMSGLFKQKLFKNKNLRKQIKVHK